MSRAEPITALILETFRLNGALLSAGDRLVGHLGLTSARWQVLGAIAYAPQALAIAHIARNMGLTRQAVRRLVNEMVADGLLRLAANPHHRRARLVLMTKAGRAAYAAAMALQTPWAEALGQDLPPAEIDAARRVLLAMRVHLSPDNDTTPGDPDALDEHA